MRYSLETSSRAKHAAVRNWAVMEHCQGPLMWLVLLVRLITLPRRALVGWAKSVGLHS